MLWLMLIAGLAACPFVFATLWQKRWFRCCWWFGAAILCGSALRAAGVLN